MSRYKNEINEQFSKLKGDYNTNYFDAQNSIRALTTRLNFL